MKIPSLVPNEIHVWFRTGAVKSEEQAYLFGLLSEAERARILRSKAVGSQALSVNAASRGSLRVLLASYLSVPAADIPLAKGRFGKPFVATEPQVFFNVTHSRDCVAFAFSTSYDLGIDIEYEEPQFPFESCLAGILSTREINQLLALPVVQRRAAFFSAWTRKEAVLKGIGTGLTTSPTAIEVTIDPDITMSLSPLAQALHPGWQLHDLDFGPRYSGSLAVRSMASNRGNLNQPPQILVRRFWSTLALIR